MSVFSKTMVAVFLVSLSVAASAKIYKWTDANGQVQYTQTPPPENVETKEMKVDAEKASTTSKPSSAMKKGASKKESQPVSDDVVGKKCDVALDKMNEIITTVEDMMNDPMLTADLPSDELAEKKQEMEQVKNQLSGYSKEECISEYKEGTESRGMVDCLNKGGGVFGLMMCLRPD